MSVPPPESSTKKTFLTSKQYDILKWIAQIFLPAFGTLYFALAGIWGLPAAEQVLGTVVSVDTFLGVLLGLSSRSYNSVDNPAGKYKGSMLMEKTEDGKLFTLDLNTPPQDLKIGDEVTFKVTPKNPNVTPL